MVYLPEVNIVKYRVALLLLLLVSLPYFSAFILADQETVFGGFLLNPVDGNTYLAKMYQGWRGDWKFSLPYSADPGQGAYLNTFYLFLGHLARWLGAPLLLIFHLARLLGAAFLVWMIERFYAACISNVTYRRFGYALASLGLGLGWLVFLFGIVTSDFWVAEAYPFLSSYVNPHFAWSLALMLWLLLPAFQMSKDGNENISEPASSGQEQRREPATKPGTRAIKNFGWAKIPLVILGSAWLGSMSPFSVVLVVSVLVGLVVWEWGDTIYREKWRYPRLSVLIRYLITGADRGEIVIPKQSWVRVHISQMVWIILGGAPVILYAVAAVRLDSQLAAWNAQNLTPTPPAWDLALAFSPAWVLAVAGIWQVIHSRERTGRLFVVWVCVVAALIYAPFGLQRRFLVGAYIPLAGLAAYGLGALEEHFGIRWAQIGMKATIALALPSTLLVLLLGQFGIISRDPLFFLEKREMQALEWLEANTSTNALVLASPRMGMFIPAHTGRRVIYGHPFETVNAAEEEAAVVQFFQFAASRPAETRSFLEDRAVDYILFLPRENELRELGRIPGLVLVYDQQNVLIYQVISP